jgi:hypothetical protein
MKSLLLFIAAGLVLVSTSTAQELNGLAEEMANEYPSAYNQLILDRAYEKQGFTIGTVVQEINDQIDSLVHLAELLDDTEDEMERYALVMKMVKGARSSYGVTDLLSLVESKPVDSVRQLIAIDCDWVLAQEQIQQGNS